MRSFVWREREFDAPTCRRDRSEKGYERYVALGILGRNLQTLGKLLLARDQADCQAAKSKRKPA